MLCVLLFIHSFSNNTGARVSAKSGGSSGMDYLIWDIAGYNKLAAFISTAFPGYAAGKNLFALPYDWRLDITAMDTTREMDRLAARISAAVAANCGKKAVLIAHSMGTLVTLGLLQNPRFQAWRWVKNSKHVLCSSLDCCSLQIPAVKARQADGASGLISVVYCESICVD